MKLTRLCLVVAIAMLVTACASTPPSPTSQQAASALMNWQVRGKFSLRTSSDSQSGSLNWQQNGRHTVLDLSGPLGLEATRIRTDGETVSIRRGDDVQTSPINALHYGNIPLPLSALRYWLRGLPAPQLPIDEQDHQNGISQSLRQGQWQLSFSDYVDVGAYRLPGRIIANGGELRIKLLLKRWKPSVDAGHSTFRRDAE